MRRGWRRWWLEARAARIELVVVVMMVVVTVVVMMKVVARWVEVKMEAKVRVGEEHVAVG